MSLDLNQLETRLCIEPAADFPLRLRFSDGSRGLFDVRALLQRSGPLLEALRDPSAYFDRAFIDAGALRWPNGSSLSPVPCPAPR